MDGIIPFWDPFGDNGGYNKCDEGLAFSRGAGAFARNTYVLGAALPRALLSSWGKLQIFYSGGAGATANSLGAQGLGVTIDMTIGGRMLNGIQSLTGRYLGDAVWKTASQIFANGARGEAVAVLGQTYTNARIFGTVELPILARNAVQLLFP